MPNFLQLELKNFKSYKDEVCIEWKQFSSIIGPNGAGKSSVVDAIEFVFCFPRYSNISVQRLRQDICNRINIDDDEDYSSTWVRITFNFNGKKTIFQRSADYKELVHKFSVDNTSVNLKEYKNRLLKYNINGKANSFLVQQNAIENVAMRGAKERCEFFENICDSIAYKEEYAYLSKELNDMNLEIEQSKKDLNFQHKLKKELTKTYKEVQKYDNLKNELADIEFDYYFSKLYQIDEVVDELSDKQTEAKMKIKIVEKIKISKENNITKLKSNLNDQEGYLKELEEEFERAQNKLSKYSSKMTELMQKIAYCEDNMKKVDRNLIQAKNIDKARENNLIDLRSQYREVEESKESYESQSQSCSLKLKDEQYEEYLKLKSEAQQKFVRKFGSFDSIERERDSIKTRIDEFNYEVRINILSEKIKQEKLYINKINSEIDGINEKIKNTESVENQTKATNSEVEHELEGLLNEKEYLNEEIQILEKEISDSSVSKEEDRKLKRKQEVLLKLKRHFPGVIDRLKNLCKAKGENYKVPVMKIIGKKMDNIVVDTRFTATECIKFLKITYAGDKFSTFETFLPLDYISKPLDNTILRKIQDEGNVKPATTVIAASEDIKKLLNHYFNVGNIIICENDDAASDLSFRKKLNCVSLNGSYYKRDGSFSGGLADLLQQLKKWNYKEYEDLKEKKQNKCALMHDLQKKINELKIHKDTLVDELEKLQKLLEIQLKPSIRKKTNELKIEETKLLGLENELLSLKNNPNMIELQKELETKNNELEKIENKKNAIEDKIFANFCKRFHITNIRQYEQGDIIKYKQRAARKKEFEILLDKINNEIEFETNRDTKTPLKNLEDQLNELQEFNLNLKENEDKLKKLINKNKLSCSKDVELKSVRKNIEEINKELKLENNQYKSMNQDLAAWNSSINTLALQISNLTVEKNKLLMNCKINNIKIPLRTGTIDTVVLKPTINVTMTESSEESSSSTNDSHIRKKELEIDYSSLPDSIKNLEVDDLNNYIISLKDKKISILEELENIKSIFKSKDKLKFVEERMKALNDDHHKKLEKIGIIKKKFNDIKTQRTNKFNEFFNSVAEQIDTIFKALYSNPSAQAYLNVKNAEEPYLDGIEFSCVIPKKKFVPMENLSGGEKTMSAVALLLAIYRVKPTPFLIFDEIDAALDNSNINKISNYLLQLKSSTQIINISHHDLLSSCADSLIGINISPYTNSSYTIHLDLSKYQKRTSEEKCLKNTLNEKPLLLKSRLEEMEID